MIVLRQAVSFAAVGVMATLSHVTCAWLLIESLALDPYASNHLGACAAFAISILGNYSLTFPTDRSLLNCARRYALVSLGSLAMTTAVLAFVRHNALPTEAYVLIVLATVPPTTFLLAKFWAFRPLVPRPTSKAGAGATS